MKLRALILVCGLLFARGQASANEKVADESIVDKLNVLQQQIELLSAQLALTKKEMSEMRVSLAAETANSKEADEKLDALADNSMSVQDGWSSRTTMGGYGELHFNMLENQEDGVSKNTVDFHRFVLFFGHEFDEKLRFFSEFELEHALAGEGKPGEVELEQAYIQYDLNENMSAQAGMFLIPVGIMNETHEPPTFYGTERNPVEKNIIPATWWAAGVGITGEFMPGVSYDMAVHSGLNTSEGQAYKPRSGRQKVAKAKMNDAAITGRIKYTAVPGLELAATVQFQNDITQGLDAAAGSASLIEAHMDYEAGMFGLKALYARWGLDGEGPARIGADVQEGYYVESSYKLGEKAGVFARINRWDNAAGLALDSQYSQFDVGLNYWIHPDVVLKFDYQKQDTPESKSSFDGINFGIGYQF